MIRVAHVVGKMFGGGVESVVMNYYRHIDRDRVQFDLLVDSDSGLVPRDEVESLGGRIIEIPPYQHVLAYQRSLRRVLSVGRWPIVHSHISTLSVFSLCAAKAAGIPVRIAHSHMAWSQGISAKSVIERTLCNFANIYPTDRLACSQQAGEWLFGKRADINLMYNAIELDRFSFSEEARGRVRSELGVSDETLVVGHLGRFAYAKNHPFLLHAFEQLLQLREDSILVLVGGGDSNRRKDAEQWIYEHKLEDKVRIFGYTDHPEHLYSAFDVLALPSFFEGLSVVGIEAQAAGLPCLFSDRTTREINISEAAQFLPIEEPRVWADALSQIEIGARIPTDKKGFDDYDIVKASEWLAGYYEQLAMRANRLS